VQRLKDSGVMQIVAITDPLQLGYGREALIGSASTVTFDWSLTRSPRLTKPTTSS